MHVIAHEAVCVNTHPVAITVASKPAEVAFAVVGCGKYSSAAVAPVGDVVAVSGNRDAGKANPWRQNERR